MLKISFTNAEVSDHGYGLEVNGKSLELSLIHISEPTRH